MSDSGTTVRGPGRQRRAIVLCPPRVLGAAACVAEPAPRQGFSAAALASPAP